MALLLGELVEVEQGKSLFDVELVHRLPFLPTVGPAALCRHADPPGQHLGHSVGGYDESGARPRTASTGQIRTVIVASGAWATYTPATRSLISRFSAGDLRRLLAGENFQFGRGVFHFLHLSPWHWSLEKWSPRWLIKLCPEYRQVVVGTTVGEHYGSLTIPITEGVALHNMSPVLVCDAHRLQSFRLVKEDSRVLSETLGR